MNIRARGTFTLNYVDPFDKIGFWNQSDPNQNGAEGRADEEEFLPDRKLKLKNKKTKKEFAIMDTMSEEIKKQQDMQTAEAV